MTFSKHEVESNRVVRLNGKLLLWTHSSLHFTMEGLRGGRLNLHSSKSKEEFVEYNTFLTYLM